MENEGVKRNYVCGFLVLLAAEVCIAVFMKDNFIRSYLGDVLAVILIYCLIKAITGDKIKRLPLYIFIFAVLVEFGQYFDLAGRLGTGRYARVIFGAVFDRKDIACYFMGCAGLFLFEMPRRSGKIRRKSICRVTSKRSSRK